jgi:ribosome-binding factor A
MSSEIRQQRVKGLLQEELMTLIPGELEDPKLALVAVTDVVVSKDLKNVRVFVNHLDEEVSQKEVISLLNKAMPFFRAQIAERLSTRTVPEITFAYDDSASRAGRLDEIFRQIKEEEANRK